MTTVTPFSEAFVTQYQDAFEELLRLGTLSARRRVEGKETIKEDAVAVRLLIVLQALSKPGLTAAQTESLEYCLVKLNKSLAEPTVETLLPQDIVPPHFYARMLPALYNMTMQDMNFTFALQMAMTPAEYVLTPQNFVTQFTEGTIVHYSISMDPAEYVLTMQNFTGTFTLGTVDVELLLEDAFLAQSFRVVFGVGARNRLTAVGDPYNDLESGNRLYSASVTMTVTKLSNAGVVLDNGVIVFRRTPFGGSEADEPGSGAIGSGLGSQTFVGGQDLDSYTIDYIFTGLAVGDKISANIYEG